MAILGKKRIFSILVSLLIVLQPFAINAGEDINLKNESINPGSFYYSFKRLWEKASEKLNFNNQSKINFYQSLLHVRLAELKYVVENRVLSEVQTSSERFAYQAGILTEALVKENQDKEKTIKEFQKMQEFLEYLGDKYPANSSFWMLIQHDINSLKILAERLK